MSKKLKACLTALMGFGVVASACAIMRTIYTNTSTSEDNSCKRTYCPVPKKPYVRLDALTLPVGRPVVKDDLGLLFPWAEAEKWVILMAANIPPIWPLFKLWGQRVASSLHSMKSTRDGGSQKVKGQEFGRVMPRVAVAAVAAAPLVPPMRTDGVKAGWIELKDAERV